MNIEEYHECDDGNTDRLDGCDHECKVEKGWDCSQPDEYFPTECIFNDEFKTSRNVGYTCSMAAVVSSSSGSISTVLV